MMTRDQVLAYYLREDVSDALWRLCLRRPLRFFYQSDADLRRQRGPARSCVLHCLSTPGAFRDTIAERVQEAGPWSDGFFPFFNLGQTANAPGEPGRTVGWDLRFEVDLDRERSFRALLPAFAVLEHFGVPVLGKYSGRRSLHLLVPAEALPAAMRRAPAHGEWMRAFDAINGLLLRLCPGIHQTAACLAKETVLTVPYSLHRYAGGVSLPLSLDEAMDFDPGKACVSRFPGAHWRPEAWDTDPAGAGAARLLEAARRVETDEDSLLALARAVFAGPRWAAFATGAAPGAAQTDPVQAILLAGAPATALLEGIPIGALRDRLADALIAIDRPEAKEMKLLRTVVPHGFQPAPETPDRVRAAVAAAFGAWVVGGMEGALAHLMAAATDPALAEPVLFATQIASLLPDPPPARLAALRTEWIRREGAVTQAPEAVFLALALAELPDGAGEAAGLLAQAGRAGDAGPALLGYLRAAGRWQSKQRPDLAAAALILAFGREVVAADLGGILNGVLGNEGKRRFALLRLDRALNGAAAGLEPDST
jgi:hypothetical protein